MKKNPQIFWTILLLVLVLIIWGFFSYGKNNEGTIITDIFKTNDVNSEVLPLGEGQTVTGISFGDKQYKHTILGYSFNYPKEYSISSFGNFFDSAGETVLLQKEGGLDGLQILVTPFNDDGLMTISKIKKDLPSLSVITPEEKQIGQDENKVQAVTFTSNNNLTTGKSLEAWFIYRKNLYQISSPENSKDLFDTIIKTWKIEQ